MLSNNTNGKPERVAIYARVSSEEQAERQTVDGQLHFLRNYCALYHLPVAGEFIDDGVSGTLPLQQRPEGRRLLEAAECRSFTKVLVLNVKRFGRSLDVIIKGHDALERFGVALASGTEPLDTSTSVGRFIFQLLASLAELDRASLLEQLSRGRDRVSRTGRWNRGPIPFGYDLDPDRFLIPSERMVPGLGMTEADVLRSIFQRVADGSATPDEAIRLNAAGVVPVRRYAGGKESHVAQKWGCSQLLFILHNPVYKGEHTIKSAQGPIVREVKPLVTPELWEKVARQLTANRMIGNDNATKVFLLRGLITCGLCGAHYAGSNNNTDGGYYQCASITHRLKPDGRNTCPGKALKVPWIEGTVWEDCRSFILNPGEALGEAQRQLRSRLEQTTGLEEQRRALLQQMAEKEAEKERVMTLFRRGKCSLEDAERQIDDVVAEASTLRRLADALRSQADLVEAFEAHLTQAGAMLAQLRGQLEEIERTDDREAMRDVVQLLVSGITVETTGEKRRKQAKVKINYRFGEPTVAVPSIASATGRAGLTPGR